MVKIALFKKENGNAVFVDRFDNQEDASDYVKELANNNEDINIFDYYTEEQEYQDICERVKTYADACEVLGVPQLDDKAMLSAGFREDEIARRKLETITAALNEGWKPDFNNTNEYKYYPWFHIKPNHYGAYAGLSYAYTADAASYTTTYFGSRLCFHDHRTAVYAGNTFPELYAKILVENF